MAKTKDTSLDFGFVQIPVAVFTAADEDDGLKLTSLCHGQKPKTVIRCTANPVDGGGEEYSAWTGSNAPPQKGYEMSGEYIILEKEEVEAAKGEREKVDSIKVEKSVDFLQVGRKYVYVKAYQVLPLEKSAEQARMNYRAVYEVVEESNRAILVRYAPAGRTRHYAAVTDGEGGFLLYEIRVKKSRPYAVPTAPADAKTKTQAKNLIESMHSDDVDLTPEPDPLFDLVQRKVDAMGSLGGIGQVVIVPK